MRRRTSSPHICLDLNKKETFMHKFLRALGLSKYTKDKDIDRLLEDLIKDSCEKKRIQIDDQTNFCELKAELLPGMGIVIHGETDKNGVFCKKYYYPYMNSIHESSKAECSIQRHTEKETYAGLLDEFKVGISLIFYVSNLFECRERLMDGESMNVDGVNLAGFSIEGKILFPMKKTARQIEMAKVASKDRSSLIEAAKNGDEDAMETLTIEDIDIYSQVSRRVKHEDLYSIVDTCFMPCGVECDQYSVIGNIINVNLGTNKLTGEEVYDLTLECSDLTFHVGIAKKDLLGEPEIGRRFKGQIWMQGTVKFQS